MPEEEDAGGRAPPGWAPLDLASLAEQPQVSSRRPEAELGRVIKGKYKIIEQIGAGGMAVVYRAEEQGLIRRDVAIKLLKSESTVSQAMLSRFMKEAQAIAAITHPNVVQLFEIDRTPEGQIYLVMERLIGKTLHQALRDMNEAGEAFSWELLAPLMLQACRALHAIHKQKIIHRDIKPSNLFCCGLDEEDWHLKVLDFGIAKAPSNKEASPDSMATPLTQDGMFVGTPHYAAPEVIRQSPATDERADLFALGVIMYQCLTGTLPFQGEHQDKLTVLFRTLNERPPSPRERAPERDIPPQVNALIMKAMAIEPGERFANAAALADAIRSTVRTTLPGNSVRKPQLAGSSSETTPGPPGEPVLTRDPVTPLPASELAPSISPSAPPSLIAADQATPRPPGAPVPPVGSPTAVQELRPRATPAVLIAVAFMSVGLLVLLLLFVYEATSVQPPAPPKARPAPPVSAAQPPRAQPPGPPPSLQPRPEPAPQPQPQPQNSAGPQGAAPAVPSEAPELEIVDDPARAEAGANVPTATPASGDAAAQDVRKRKCKTILDKLVESRTADTCLPLHLAVADGVYDEFPVKVQIDPRGKAKASASTRPVKQRLPKSADACLLKVIEAQSFPEGEGAIVVNHTLRFD